MAINLEKKRDRARSQERLSQSLDEEQFSEILSAIIDGKYSWACALLLKCTGHDPRNYLPYRTYIRLVKERCQNSEDTSRTGNGTSARSESSSIEKKSRRRISDLSHLEPLDRMRPGVFGGNRSLEIWEDATDRDVMELDLVGSNSYLF